MQSFQTHMCELPGETKGLIWGSQWIQPAQYHRREEHKTVLLLWGHIKLVVHIFQHTGGRWTAHNSVTEELREAEYRGEEEGDGTEAEGEAHAPLAHLVLPAPLAARREALVRRHL